MISTKQDKMRRGILFLWALSLWYLALGIWFRPGGMNPAQADPDNVGRGSPEERVHPDPASAGERVPRIYQLDEEIRLKEVELKDISGQAEQAERENKFERAYQLKQKAGELNEQVKNLKDTLAQQVKDYETSFNQQPWWQQLTLETSAFYTFFDSDLGIDNGWGVNLKLMQSKNSFQRFSLGSYLYYPLGESANYPLRQVEAAPIILEYRRFQTHAASSTKDEVEVSSYLVGFGAFTQGWENTYLSLNLSGGLQHYQGTVPSDTGPLVSYTVGIHHKLLASLSLGLEINEEAVWTKANHDDSHFFFNFASAFVIRFSF